MANLLKPTWSNLDPGDLRFILYERIGRPGHYCDRAKNPGAFYLPLADATCRVKLTFSEQNQLIAIEPGPAFDAAQWDQVTDEIEAKGPIKVGRDCSFSSFRVVGSWKGALTGIQILPPPPDAPVAPCETAEHPFILEFPLKVSNLWPITNYRRMKEHRRLTLLLNILLAGRTCMQPRQLRNFWAVDPRDGTFSVKWVQEYFFAKIGVSITDSLSPLPADRIKEVASDVYYTSVGHDGRGLGRAKK